MATKPPRPITAVEDFDEFGGDQIVWEDLSGALVLVRPTSVERGINTQHGLSDAVYADVAVLDGEHEGDTYRDALVFPKGLVGQLKRATMGKLILGRVIQGPAKTDPETGEVMVDPNTGEPYNRPWKFDKPTPEDSAAGRSFLAQRRKSA